MSTVASRNKKSRKQIPAGNLFRKEHSPAETLISVQGEFQGMEL